LEGVDSVHFTQELINDCVSIALCWGTTTLGKNGIDLEEGGMEGGREGGREGVDEDLIHDRVSIALGGGTTTLEKNGIDLEGRRKGGKEGLWLLFDKGGREGGREERALTSSKMIRCSLLLSPRSACSLSASSNKAPV